MPDGPNIDAPPHEETGCSERTPPKKRQSGFRLPPAVSMQKEQLPSGWAYVFRHAKLACGRLVGTPSSGHCEVVCEVAGDPADPLTASRAVMEP